MQYCKECGSVLQRGTDKCVKCGADINLGEPYVVYRQFEYQGEEANTQNNQYNYQQNISNNPNNYQNNMQGYNGYISNKLPMPNNQQNYKVSAELDRTWSKCLYIAIASVIFSIVFIYYSNNGGWQIDTLLDAIRFVDEKINIFYLMCPLIIAVAFTVCYFEDDIIATVCIVVTINLFRLWYKVRGVNDRVSLPEVFDAIGIIALIIFSILLMLDVYQYGDKMYDVCVLFSVLHLVIYIFSLLNQLNDESYFVVDFSSLLAPVFYYLQFGYWGLALQQE